MADQQVYPQAPANGYAKVDVESQSAELRRKKRIKCFAYIAAFAVFQTIIILVFALTVMRIKTPDVKLGTVTVETINVGTAASPSFSMRLIAEVTVKNKNFGHYKFDESTATFSYGGMKVGEALIPKGRAKARKTRRMTIVVDVNSAGQLSGNSNLSNEISTGMLTLSSHTKLSGKVTVMKVMKKRKTAEMNCTMTINVASRIDISFAVSIHMVYPQAPANGYAKVDVESQSAELHRKKKIKCFAYIAAFAVFQTIIILVFALTVMRIKTPDVKLGTVTVETLNVGTAASPSFSMRLIAEVTVKNKNFGHYKFDESTTTFSYGSTIVGQTLIPKGRAKARKTRRMTIAVDVNSNGISGNSNLSSEISRGMLTLSSHTKLSGKVTLMKLMKKRKIAEMNCTMTINVASQSIQNLNCE
ncbi:hypothetical protein HHK36_027634 [Tetracentron sinense]|uniref:Late embryogenesis abundant protein LEA-2 subgroup domain-containing protein n=1 Tax=Tetracentron sinense TaxID=13715 RepID=A0A834YDK2_TETSI|nr:hypothetical protein HHK36_027634 [Tetracentron sinense]